MRQGKNDNHVNHAINKEAIRALVELLGARETARQTGVKVNTVMGWAGRYKWKKKGFVKPTLGHNCDARRTDATQEVLKVLENMREKSVLNLARYTHKASKAALQHEEPLKVARAVRDVAATFNTIWPGNEETSLIEGAILIGEAKVLDNVEELKEATIVREALPDQRPDSH
jgi:hypothetical protein